MKNVSILILAAGASRRMGGRDKLLMPLGGVALLRHVAARAHAAGAPVFVALPRGADNRLQALDGLAITPVWVADPAEGMAAALRAGLAAAGPTRDGVLVALADMPALNTEDYTALIAAFERDPENNIQRAASADGRPGNPVLLPRWAFEGAEFTADRGARDLLAHHSACVRLVRLPGDHALCDLDSPQDWDTLKLSDPDST